MYKKEKVEDLSQMFSFVWFDELEKQIECL